MLLASDSVETGVGLKQVIKNDYVISQREQSLGELRGNLNLDAGSDAPNKLLLILIRCDNGLAVGLDSEATLQQACQTRNPWAICLVYLARISL